MGTGGYQEWLLDLASLGFTAVLVAAIVLIRRWLLIRSRRPLPGLPPEPVLPFSRHGTLHDPKYLGRMLEAEGKSKDP